MRMLSFFLILTAWLLSSCSGKDLEVAALSGNLQGLGNDTLYIYGMDKLFDRIDTIPVTDDHFRTDIKVDTLLAANLLLPDGSRYPLFLDKGDRLSLKGESVDDSYNVRVKGSKANEEYAQFSQKIQQLTDPTKENIILEADSFITSHPFSIVSVYLLEKYFIHGVNPSAETITRLFEPLSGDLKDRPNMMEVAKLLKNLEEVKVNKMAPFYTFTNQKGETINRNKFLQKYVLINFWATWDAQSTSFNEVLKRIHKDKRSKDLVLLSVSLDLDKSSWLDGIEQDTLQWEHVCDGNGWNSEYVTQFGVKKIPSNLLLNPSGRIIQTDLDEKALNQLLKKMEKEEKEKKEQERKLKIQRSKLNLRN